MTTKIDISKYTEQQIKDLLDNNSLKDLLYKYKLTADFCVMYILSTDKYAWSVEETYYDVYDVLMNQPHLTKKDIDEAFEKL